MWYRIKNDLRVLIHQLSKSIAMMSLLASCNLVGGEQTDTRASEGKLLAQVQEAKLYEADLAGIVPVGASPEDSTEITRRYIESWIKKQLMLNQAREVVEIDEAVIERKLLDYKYDLIAYQYEKEYIEKKLDTTVSREDIERYYQENPANFELKQNIIQGFLIEIPQEVSDQEEIRLLLQNYEASDFPKLKEYCIKFAQQYHLNDTLWMDFDELIKNTPFQQIPNRVDFLQQNDFSVSQEAQAIYFLKILDYKISNQISPLSFVSNRIKNIIINQRKVALSRALEQEIYEKAKKSNSFKIYK